MKSKFFFLIIGLAGTVVSCSRKDAIQPTELVTPIDASQVKVINGRLVFTDQKALDQVRSELRTLAVNAPSGKTLDAWEQNIGFKSLRADAAQESVNLEAKQVANQATPAYDLVSKFGFPNFIASIINPSGEYQVGDKIYWFHDNVKYQANSESELASIKQNPSLATTKFYAGLSEVNPNKDHLKGIANSQPSKSSIVSTNRVTIGNYGGANGYNSYVSQTFYLNGDLGSQRHTVYGLRVYTEAAEGGYYTALYLQIIYQYYSNGRRAWYAAVGNSWSYDVNVQYTGYITALGGVEAPTYPPVIIPTRNIINNSGSLTTSGTYDTGEINLQMGAAYINAAASDSRNTHLVSWDISVTGYINGNATNTNPVQGYYISNNPIW
jgi:hypothetical protein